MVGCTFKSSMAAPFECLRRFNACGVSMAAPFQCLRRLKVSGFKVQSSMATPFLKNGMSCWTYFSI
jgi:hypothetical protein